MLSSGTFIVQAISVLLSPVFTRLYSPADYGLFGLYSSALVVCAPFTTLSYESAIYIESDDNTAVQIMRLCAMSTLLTAGAVIIGLVLFGERLLSGIHAGALLPMVLLVGVGTAARGISLILGAWATRRRTFRQMAGYSVSQNILYNSAQLIGGIAKCGGIGLIAGDVVGYLGICTLYSRYFLKQDGALLAEPPSATVWGVARRYRRFPMMLVPSCVLGKLVVALPPIWLAASYGPREVGLFGLAYRLLLAPVDLLTGSISQVYRAQLAAMRRERPEQIRRFVVVTFVRLIVVAVPCLVLLTALVPPAIGVFFGTRWHDAGGYVRALSPFVLGAVVVSPLSSLLYVAERQDLHLAFDVVRLALVAGAFAISRSSHLRALSCLTAYSTAMLAAYALMLALVLHVAQSITIVAVSGEAESSCDDAHIPLRTDA